jgi:hypothetical protein
MSGDESTFLFGTAANNFYNPPYPDPPYPPFAAGALPPNFLLGGFENLWARNIIAGTTTLVTVAANGESSANQTTLAVPVTAAPGGSLPKISGSGRFVVFSSTANNLAAGIVDNSSKGGIFLRDLQTGVTSLISAKATGNTPAGGLVTNFALATDDAGGKTSVTMDGTLLSSMQTQFSTDDVSPGSHLYQVAYPLIAPASAGMNPAILAVAGVSDPDNVVYQYRGATRTTAATPTNPFLGFHGEVRVATGDVNGDGVADYIYGAGPGYAPTVVVVDGDTGAVIMRFNAFAAGYRGGIYLASADVNADGYDDIIVGAGNGHSPEVKVFSGKNGSLLMDFQAYGRSFNTGVRVAGGDVNGNGYADIITGAGPDRAPVVNVFSGQSGALLQRFRSGSGRGVYVAAADMEGDGVADIATSSDSGPVVNVYNGSTGARLDRYNAGHAFARGARVAARAGQIVLGTGPGHAPLVRVVGYDGMETVDQFTPFNPKNRKGLFVG